MQQPIKDYARIGVVHSMAYPQVAEGKRGFVETLREILNDDYFSAVELGPVGDDREREQARELLGQSGAGQRKSLASWRLGERNGAQETPRKGAETQRGSTRPLIAVAFGAQGILLGRGLDLCAHDDVKRDAAVQAVCGGVDEALSLGASSCGILAGKDPGRFKREQAMVRLVKSVSRICEYAAEKGNIVVELEQFDRVPYGKNSLIGPVEEALALAQEIRRHHQNFGLLIDLSHLPLLNEKPRRAVNLAGEFLTHAHIGNCVMRDPKHSAYGDRHPVFGIPEGENDTPEIKEFLAGLMDVAFLEREGQRILSFEVKPFGTQTTQDVLAISKEKLDQAWRQL